MRLTRGDHNGSRMLSWSRAAVAAVLTGRVQERPEALPVGRVEVAPAVDGAGVERDGREDLGDAAVPVHVAQRKREHALVVAAGQGLIEGCPQPPTKVR